MKYILEFLKELLYYIPYFVIFIIVSLVGFGLKSDGDYGTGMFLIYFGFLGDFIIILSWIVTALLRIKTLENV